MIFISSSIALIIGFILDCIIGDPHSMPHPIVFIGNMISLTEKILRKILPKTPKGEFIAGIFLVVIVIFISAAIPFLLLLISWKIHFILYIAVESVMCWQILAAKSLRDESMKVYKSLLRNDIEDARFNVSMIVGRDTAVLDDIGITKAAVETVAENTSDGVIAPMLYCAIGGAPLAFLYKSINTMDSMVGYKNDKYLYFGRFAAKLDDAVNYIPARLAALIMVISCVFVRYDICNAWKIWRRDRRKHASPNSAQTESVCAGALNIRLAGDAWYHGKLHEKDYIGDDNRAVEYEDIRRANVLMYVATVISLVIFSLIKAVLFGVFI